SSPWTSTSTRTSSTTRPTAPRTSTPSSGISTGAWSTSGHAPTASSSDDLGGVGSCRAAVLRASGSPPLRATPQDARDLELEPVFEAAAVLGGYLLGSLPFGYWLVRLFRGEDIRTRGSGNTGATNVFRLY